MDETTLTIDVCSLEEVKLQTRMAFNGVAQATPRHTFLSQAALLRMLTPTRWGIIAALTGQEPLGVRELARRVGRDVKAVHTDAQTLVGCGLIDKTSTGKLSFPYKAVHVDFMLRAA